MMPPHLVGIARGSSMIGQVAWFFGAARFPDDSNEAGNAHKKALCISGERESPPSPPDEPDGEDGEDGDLTLEQETSLAVEATEYWLDRRASDTFPEFSGAELSTPLHCYDLEDRLICFRFAVEKDAKTVGTMTIGSSLYDNAAFEVNDGYLPEPPSPSEVVAIAERDLDITVRSPVSEQPERFLYLGLLDTCAVYEVEGQEVAVNLQSERAARIADLQMRITTPEQYATDREEDSKGDGRDYTYRHVLDEVPLRWMNDPNMVPAWMRNRNNCGPTAGAMIMGYYRDELECDSLPNWPQDHAQLYYTMGCNAIDPPGGVPPEPVGHPGEGWVETADDYGYPHFVTSYDGGVTNGEWSDLIVSQIDSLCPILVMFWEGTPHEPEELDFSNHWNALKGYEEEDGHRSIYTNDPWNFERVLDWTVYYPHIHLTMLWDSPPTVGMEMVKVSRMDVVRSWFTRIPNSLVAFLPGFQDKG